MKLPHIIDSAFPARPVESHKYSIGVVSVVGGSFCYANAPVIAGLGARAAGAGLVRLVAPEASRACAGALLPEATYTALSESFELPSADVVVAGMGLARTEASAAVFARLASCRAERMVLDADALFFLAERGGASGARGFEAVGELVLTPHEGEAARLLGVERARVASDRPWAVREIAGRYGATVVLKGPRTLVASPGGERVFENDTGNPFMALGGMGDLLAGAIGARWAYLRGDAFTAAASAVWLHGAASDELVASGGDPSIVNTAAAMGSLRVRLEGGLPARALQQGD